MLQALRARSNLAIWLFAVFLIASGEELWMRFVPAYIVALGGSLFSVAAYGTLKDFLDAVYQFPGGVITARLGTKRALLLFNALAIAGYGLFASATSPIVVLAALPLIMAWASFSLPASFSLIGELLPKAERSMGFAWQSIIRRIPTVLAPVAGGALIATYSTVGGIRIALVVCIGLGLAALLTQACFNTSPGGATKLSVREALRDVTQLDGRLKALLTSDIIVRFGQGLGEVFVVIYATTVLGASFTAFGVLTGIAMATSIAVYIPVARIADRRGRTPWVALTYLFFAAFPLALAATTDARFLFFAFLLMGLREIGEPPRKALIVEWAREGRKSVDIGAYYFVRGITVFPASLVGGILWRITPRLTFLVAGLIALTGAAVWSETRRRTTAD